MKASRFLPCFAVAWGLIAGAGQAQTPPTDTIYMSGLGSGTAIADTDTMFACQNALGCGLGVDLVSVSGTQLTTYFRSKVSATAPIVDTAGVFSITGPSNLTTFAAGTIPRGATTSPFVASEITDVASGGVVIGSATGGQKGAGTLNATGLYINGVATITGNQTITLSGDTTGSGATAITTTTGKVNGVSYGAGPSTNTVPVVTGSNTVTYEAVPNAALANAATTVNGQTCTLGSSCTVTASSGTITVGTTLVAGGATTRVLYDNAGTLGEMTTSGTGTTLALAAAPTISALTVTGSLTAPGLVTNADLVNPATTVNGQICTLGSTCTVTAAATGITVGTTAVGSSATGKLLTSNAGTLADLGLASSHILVGSASNVPADVAMSQDCTLDNAGVITCLKTNNVAFTSAATTSLGTSGATIPLLNGTNTWSATQSLDGTHTVTGLPTPSGSTDAANKAYVDNLAAAINPAVAVKAATTQASDTSGLTYTHVAGIGDFFTGSNNTAITFDGVTLTAVNQRVLIKNDTQSPSGAFNGVYYLSQLQTTLLPPILVRALDYDQPSDINNTGAIPVVSGTVNGSTSWLLTSSVTTVGTDPLTYTQFSLNPTKILTTTLTNAHFLVGNSSAIATDVAMSGDCTLANNGQITCSTKASSTLTSAHLFVGNGSNVATDVPMSGDASLANTGAVTVSKVNGDANVAFLDATQTFTSPQTFGEVHPGLPEAVTLTSNDYVAVAADCGKIKTLPTGTTPTVHLPNLNVGCTIRFVTTAAISYQFLAASGGSVINSQAFSHTPGTNAGDQISATIVVNSGSAAKWAIAGDLSS